MQKGLYKSTSDTTFTQSSHKIISNNKLCQKTFSPHFFKGNSNTIFTQSIHSKSFPTINFPKKEVSPQQVGDKDLTAAVLARIAQVGFILIHNFTIFLFSGCWKYVNDQCSHGKDCSSMFFLCA